MTTLNDLKTNMKSLQAQIKKMLASTSYEEYGDLGDIKYDDQNPDDLMFVAEYELILNKLSHIQRRLSYLNKPVTHEGILSLRSDGRYGLANGTYYTSGSTIEFLNETENLPAWRISTVEHDDTGYFIVYHKNVKLDGLRVRTR